MTLFHVGSQFVLSNSEFYQHLAYYALFKIPNFCKTKLEKNQSLVRLFKSILLHSLAKKWLQ